mgnify:CR=1 FL=1
MKGVSLTGKWEELVFEINMKCKAQKNRSLVFYASSSHFS